MPLNLPFFSNVFFLEVTEDANKKIRFIGKPCALKSLRNSPKDQFYAGIIKCISVSIASHLDQRSVTGIVTCSMLLYIDSNQWKRGRFTMIVLRKQSLLFKIVLNGSPVVIRYDTFYNVTCQFDLKLYPVVIC